MATPQERELILREVGSVFGEFQHVLNTLHNDYWNGLDKKTNSLSLPSMEKILGEKFIEFARIYTGFHGYLTMIKRVLEQKGDKLVFADAVANVHATCAEWSEHLKKWKEKFAR